MKVTFFSNFFNSHQLPLALAFCDTEGVEYTFASMQDVSGVVGRASLDNDYPFVLKAYDSQNEAAIAMHHAIEDDIVVFGDMAGKECYVRARAKTGRLFLRYEERLRKPGERWGVWPPKNYRKGVSVGR